MCLTAFLLSLLMMLMHIYYFYFRFVLRRDLLLAISNAKQRIEDISPQTLILFTNHVPAQIPGTPLKLWKILDLAPTTITDKTPMETVVNMFRKLGLRQTLVKYDILF